MAKNNPSRPGVQPVRPAPGPNPDQPKIERLRWMLNTNVPVIGGWMHRRVLTALTESARAGNAMAVQSLALALAYHQEPDVRRVAQQALRKVNFASGIDMAWSVWVESRSPELEKILVEGKRIAGNPASIRLLSALRMDDTDTVTRGSSDLVPALIAALDDRDPLIAARARNLIENLRNPSSVDALCRAWQESRSERLVGIIQAAGYVAQKPARTRVLSALAVNDLQVVMHAAPEMVAPLVEACADPDAAIASRAASCLLHLQSQPAIDAFCQMWAEQRSPLLEDALLKAGYRARHPLDVRLLVALKTGHLPAAQEATPEGLPVLLVAAADSDPVIAANASAALHSLALPETRDALCLRFIQAEDDQAGQIALQAGYAPREPELRALFYFLTEQWDAYDQIDYDQSMMRALYEAGASELRQRIAARVQSAGRTPYLTILAGVDYRSRADEVNAAEANLLIKILADNGEWQRLWALAPELALPFSLHIVRLLAQNGWQPEDEMERRTLSELLALADKPMLLSGPELSRALPLALPRASLHVGGRVNDVAFSPAAPLLAIASSQRKVVLWNFKTAQVERVIEAAFTHSVGRVAYTPSGALACGERSTGQAICTVYVYQDGNSYHLCNHEGTVTALESVGDNRLLTAGRDAHIAMWDLDDRRVLTDKEFPFWARAAEVSPDGQYVALLHARMSLARLPELTIVPGQPFIAPRERVGAYGTGYRRATGFSRARHTDEYRLNPGGTTEYRRGTGQHAAYSPDGKYILSGQHNGQLVLYYHTSLTQRPRQAVVTDHNGPVRGVHFLPGHPLVISAGADGEVRFIRWPEMTLAGMARETGGKLTSLHVSRSGSFMATGTSESSLRLWDLRTLDIPALFAQPLATATHDQISTVLALGEYETLPEPVRTALQFMRLLLQYRFRYDIQIEDAHTIRFGDFDILLEEG